MEIGETRTVSVQAQPRWNDTGIRLVAGARYEFSASGRWRDWFVRCGAGGYSFLVLRPLNGLKRVPSAPWFALIGSIDADNARAFPIGTGRAWVAPAAGVLTCFANDIGVMYWNNRGTVDLTVRRVA